MAEHHASDSPWSTPDSFWNLDDVHGLSVFLPLGEDRELSILIKETSPITPSLELTRNLHLREMYTCDQLTFVCDTGWGALIQRYYDVMASFVPTNTADGPLGGLLPPDVTPPKTTITIKVDLAADRESRIIWVATDAQAGVDSATLWYRPAGAGWIDTGKTQTGSAGEFSFKLADSCGDGLAVRAVDKAGNTEPLGKRNNTVPRLGFCTQLWLPLIMHNSAATPGHALFEQSVEVSGGNSDE